MPKKKVTEAVEETAQETIPVEKAPAQMPRRQGSEDLLELNDLERGVTREDIAPSTCPADWIRSVSASQGSMKKTVLRLDLSPESLSAIPD